MHEEQTQFVDMALSALRPVWRGDEKIIEIGSLDVNGSIRSVFGARESAEYVGLDLIDGPGVDFVCPGEAADFPNGHFDAAVSCECFEHNPKWLETFVNMHRMTAAGGCVIFTCASVGRAEHGTRRTTPQCSPGTQHCWQDYYRNLAAADFYRSADIGAMFSGFRFYYNPLKKDLYFAGVKGAAAFDKNGLDKKVAAINRPSLRGKPVTVPRQIIRRLRFALGRHRVRVDGGNRD